MIRNGMKDGLESLKVLKSTIEVMAKQEPSKIWTDLILAYRLACFALGETPDTLQESLDHNHKEVRDLIDRIEAERE